MVALSAGRVAVSFLCFVGVAWLAPVASPAADVLVTKTADTNDGQCTADCSLREAIDTANPGDTIVIPVGVFTLTGGEIDIDEGLVLQGAGAHDTIVQAAAAPFTAGHRIFNVSAVDSDLALRDLTIRHGSVLGSGAGGAIRWMGGTGNLEITRSKVVLNEVNADGPTDGGAASGGAIFFTSSGGLTFTESTVADNRATANGGTGSGGAVSGGAIFSSGASLASFVRSTVARNRISAVGAMDTGAASGGAIFCTVLTLTNSTASENETIAGGAASGGAIFCSTVELSSSTVADNRLRANASSGGGIFAQVTARNSIVARNEVDDCTNLTSDGYNLVGVDCGITAGPGDEIGTEMAPIDPLLGPVADNGGKTETQALPFGSPAIDMGNPAGCTDEGGTELLVDQRGFARVSDGDGDGVAICDIGAFEAVLDTPVPVLGWLGLIALGAGLSLLGMRRLGRGRSGPVAPTPSR